MHSSRMRTVRCSGRLLGGGEVCSGGCLRRGLCALGGVCLGACTPPSCGQNDRHYFSATTTVIIHVGNRTHLLLVQGNNKRPVAFSVRAVIV